jgi:hypothetical protein
MLRGAVMRALGLRLLSSRSFLWSDDFSKAVAHANGVVSLVDHHLASRWIRVFLVHCESFMRTLARDIFDRAIAWSSTVI